MEAVTICSGETVTVDRPDGGAVAPESKLCGCVAPLECVARPSSLQIRPEEAGAAR